MAKKKKKLMSGYYDANTGKRITDANIVENESGWKIETIKTKSKKTLYNNDGTVNLPNSLTNDSINKRLTSKILQEDIKNTTFKVATGQNKKQIDLSGKDKQLTTPVTKEEIGKPQYSTFSPDRTPIIAKIGSTIGDVATNIGRGFLNNLEGLTDLGHYGVAGISDLLGAKDFANDVRNLAKQDATSMILQPAEDTYNKNSVLKSGGIAESVSQGIGYIGATIGSSSLLPQGTQAIKVGKFALPTTTLTSGVGSGMTNAYNEGASDSQAVSYGVMSGLVEALSESMFSGLGQSFGKVTGGGALDDVVIGKLTNKISNKAVQTLAQSGLKATGEGLEEVVSGLGNAFAKKLTYMSEEEINKLIEDEDLLNSFVVGTLTSTVAQTPVTISSIKNGTDYMENSNENTTNNINIPTNENISQNEAKYQNTINFPVNNQTKQDIFMNSVKQYNINPNNEAVKSIDRICKERGIISRFDATEFKNKNIESFWRINTDEKGNITKREIVLNPNTTTQKAIQNLAIHELGHDLFAGSTSFNEIHNMIQTLDSTKTDYENARNMLKDIYKNQYTNLNKNQLNQLIDEEATMHILGNKLGNQEFINQLTAEKPSIARKIYNWVVDKLNKINKLTGYKNEKLFWTDVKNKFENAYKEEFDLQENVVTNQKNMMTSTKGMENGIKANTKYNDIKNRYNEALSMENKYTNEEIRQKTGWFKDNEGNWEFEISDKNVKIKNENKLQKNTTYNLEDVLEAKTLYDMYPDLKNIKVKFQDIKKSGRFNQETKTMTLNNSHLSNLENLKGTMLHEIQHYIQKIEGLSDGATILFGNKQYAENKGEIEAADTKRRMDMTVEERKKIAPESSKKNPIHPNKEALLNYNRNKVEQAVEKVYNASKKVEKIANKLYNKFGDEIDETIKNFEKNINIDSRNISNSTNKITGEKNSKGLGFNRRNDVKELDNSSFNFEEKQKEQWEKYLDKNYTPSGTRTTIKEINIPTKQETKKSTNKITSDKSGIPINEKYLNKNNKKKQLKNICDSINESIKSDVIVEKGQETKERRWIETSLNSDVVKGNLFSEDLNSQKTEYVVASNKKTLEKANNKLNILGYGESLKQIQSKINDNSVKLEDVALAQRLIQEAIKKGDNATASELIMDTAILGTDLGQKVQALSMINRLTPEGQLRMFQKIVTRAKVKGDKSFENVEITPEMVDIILNAYDEDGKYDQQDLNKRVEQFKQKVADQMKTTTSEKIVAWRYLSMLGNPKTHLRNIISNVAMYGTLKVKNATARTIETIAPVKNRTKTWKKASDDVKSFSTQTTNEMKDIITGEGKYSEKTSLESKKQTFNNKILEKIKDFNSDALSIEDWIFSKSAFKSSLQEYLTAQGIKTKEDIENNSEIVEKAKLYAIEQAEIATFRQYSYLANKISNIENKNGITKVVVGSTIPFKKTPINIAKTGVKYSPIGLIKSVSYDAYQVKKGNMEASQMIDNLSQGLTGTSLTLIGYALAKAGILKGAGDDDKEGKYDSYLGNQTYSVKIGDSTYSISWLSPVAMPLLVGANAYEKLERKSEWDMNVVIETLAQTLDPLSEMSFLSSLDDILSSYDSGLTKFADAGGKMAQNYITQFFPTLFSQIASVFDDKKRTTRASNDSSFKFGEETLNKIMYKIPGLRNQLQPSTDIWGNEVKQSNDILQRSFETFIAPYSKKEDITTELDKELKRVYKETGDNGVIPSIPYAYIQYDNVKYQLSSKEYTKFKKDYGQLANEYLNLLIDNEDYKKLNDEEKAKAISKLFDFASVSAKNNYLKKRDVDYEPYGKKTYMKWLDMGMSNKQIVQNVINDID